MGDSSPMSPPSPDNVEPQPRHQRPNYVYIILAALLFVFVVVKVHSFWGRPYVTSGDEGVWTMIAERGLLSRGFWVGPRPFTVPLLYNLLDCHRPGVVRAQVVVSILSWSVLAWFAARLFRPAGVRVAAFALILGFGLVVPINQWDWVIRSESLSLSLFALFFGLCLAYAQHGLPRDGSSRRRSILLLAALLLVAAMWLFTRDTNVYTLLSLTVTAPIAALVPSVRRRIRWRQLLIGCGAAVALCWVSRANMMAARRYASPLMNIVFNRALVGRAMFEAFRDDLGMPVNQALLDRRGKKHSSDQRYAFKAPELQAFRDWLYSVAPSRYQRYLLTHPGYSVTVAYRLYPEMVNDPRSFWGKGAGETDVTRALTRVLFHAWPVNQHPYVVFAVGALGAVVVLIFGDGRRRWLAGAALLLFLNAAGQTFVATHGDALDVLRHGFIVAVLTRLGLLFMVLVVVDTAAEGAANSGRQMTEEDRSPGGHRQGRSNAFSRGIP